eukprot:8843527-Pyramimonas_sp.AAC.1
MIYGIWSLSTVGAIQAELSAGVGARRVTDCSQAVECSGSGPHAFVSRSCRRARGGSEEEKARGTSLYRRKIPKLSRD